MSRARFVLLLSLITAFASAQTNFAPLADKIRGQALSLPAETPLVSITPADPNQKRQIYLVRRTFAPDGTFTVEWKSAVAESFQTFRPDGTLLSGKQTNTKSGVVVEARSDAKRTTLQTVVTEKGKTKSDKRAALTPAIALREELQHLNLQAWGYGIRDGLKFQSLSPDGGMLGDFQIVFRTVSDPTKLTDKYSYPDEFKAALAAKTDYVVADMSLQGVGAFFYPHHFYLVYRPVPGGLQFVAYFGEDPKAPVFQYTPSIN